MGIIVNDKLWYYIYMNNRDYKNFAPSEIYHVYNRGVGKMDIFKDKEDYSLFLFRLKENLFPEQAVTTRKSAYRRKIIPSGSFSLISYCLMANHFHLLIKQNGDIPVSKLMAKLLTSYSKYFNKKYDRVGSLFQDQFKCVRIETNEQLLWVSLYIHENPIKAKIVKDLAKYNWNSYLDYAGMQNENLCDKKLILEQYDSPIAYLNYFKDKKLQQKINNRMIASHDLLIDDNS